MPRPLPVLLAAALLATPLSAAPAHELFLTLSSYFLPASAARVRVPVLGAARARVRHGGEADGPAEVSLVSAAGRETLGAGAWEGRRDSALVSLVLGAPGTYLVGAATHPRTLALKAGEFNDYLREAGLGAALDARRRGGDFDRPARERSATSVKAVFQKGAPRTAGFDAVLGHAAELVPLGNPYALGVGDTLDLRCLLDGRPAPGEAVIVGGVRPSGAAIAARQLRADPAGVVRVPLLAPGRWYARFVHLERLTADSTADYESRWATLTFAVRDE